MISWGWLTAKLHQQRACGHSRVRSGKDTAAAPVSPSPDSVPAALGGSDGDVGCNGDGRFGGAHGRRGGGEEGGAAVENRCACMLRKIADWAMEVWRVRTPARAGLPRWIAALSGAWRAALPQLHSL